MKYGIVLAFACLASLSHADLTPTAALVALSPAAQAPTPNEALCLRYYDEVLSQGKLESVDGLFDPAFSSDAALPGIKKGLDGLKDFVTKLRSAFPDASFQVLQMVSQGDSIVCRYQFSGTHKARFLSLKATHQKALVTGIDLWQIENGKIVQQHGNFDSLGLLVQLKIAPELK